MKQNKRNDMNEMNNSNLNNKGKENSSMNVFRLILLLAFVIPVGLFGQREKDSKLFSPASGTTFSGVLGSGARAYGMGGAFIAIADDATAASWNPGGLGQLEKPELSLVARYQNYRTLQPAQLVNPYYLIGPQDYDGNALGFDFISFTYPFRIGKHKIVPQISYQRSISFDIRTRMNNVRTMITEPGSFMEIFSADSQVFTGGIDTVTFSLGSKLFNRINIGISANVMLNGLNGRETSDAYGKFTPQLPFPTENNYSGASKETIRADIDGFNINVGVLVDIANNFKVGMVYKSASTLNFDYKVTNQQVVTINNVSTQTGVEYGAVKNLKWPYTIGLGISYRPSDPLTISADLTTTRWSRSIIRNFYIKESDNTDKLIDVYFPTFTEVSNDIRKMQVDTMQVRGGMEYILMGKNYFLIPIRFGIFSDTQYYVDSTGKKVTLFGVTGGAGIKKGAFSFDMAIMYEFGNYLKSNYDYSETLFHDFRIYSSIIFTL